MCEQKNIVIKQYSKNDEEYHYFQDFLGSKTASLFKHELDDQRQKRQEMEEKEGFMGRFCCDNCFFFDYQDVRVCMALDNSFRGMVCGQYLETLNHFPNYFGTGDALDIVRALYINNGFNDTGYNFLRYIDVALVFETCCYVFLKKDNVFDEQILRIDLFREIKPDKNYPEKLEFIGGLFHALKHYSYQGRNLSTGKEIKHNEIHSLMDVVINCIHAFINKYEEQGRKGYIFDQQIDNGKILRYVFYKEKCTNTFYLDSIHLKNKKKQ